VRLALATLLAEAATYLNNKVAIDWPENKTTKKVVILGFDGTEHTLLEAWVKEGKLPNIAKLMASGSYSTLATTTPSQSPTAWSSFSTGTNPGKHDVMDFIIRDPKTYTPTIGIIGVDATGIGKPVITSIQKGKTFWDILSENGIMSKIIKVPITFPPKPMDGKLLSGLGTPDASGSIGTFSYYTTTKTTYIDNDMAYYLYNLEDKKILDTKIQGPKTFSQKLTIKRYDGSVVLTVGDKAINLKVGEWSDYVKISFNIIGPLYKESGIAKFYLEESKPDLKLYLSPVSFDPAKPFYNISYPVDYAKSLASENGNFKSVGFSADVWALKEERISDGVFLEDLHNTFDEEIKIMKTEMAKKDWNVYVQVFQATDLVQHMFWRYLDPNSPRYKANSKFQDAILNVYEKMDRVIGEAQKTMPPGTTFIIMSDHGFKPYNKSVDLNAWLVDNGYMTLKDPSKRGDWITDLRSRDLWGNVDWSRTKAYAVGMGSLYINLQGREGKGIVTASEYSTLRDEIKSKLLKLKDGNINVTSSIDKSEDVMHGEYLCNAPDLLIGFAVGYRISWQTTFGAVPKQVIFVNDNNFSGDHISVDPKLVPGIFLSNTKFSDKGKSILDIAPTVLNYFEINTPSNMDGKIIK
jgi:predicted AlkP superfamily phosphohydrolase/phosphomutase